MPRLIDQEGRRREIAEATWRLIRRSGLDGVSVRTLAREAGLSTGSLRHVFPTQAELLTFAMETLGERLGRRLAALVPAATPFAGAAAVLEQILPLDDERQLEAEVWFSFAARSRTDPDLGPAAGRVDAVLRALVREALAPLALADLELSVEETYALVDGLALHGVLWPGSPPPDTMRRVLHAHLAHLVERGRGDAERA
jgi:AcrR family transcriptional regulator